MKVLLLNGSPHERGCTLKKGGIRDGIIKKVERNGIFGDSK